MLSRTSLIRDLGVLWDDKLSLNEHLESVFASASRTLGLIYRLTRDFRDPLCIKLLYCSLVKSTLEYASVVFGPVRFGWILRFEKVQKRFTRFAFQRMAGPNAAMPSYESRCNLLGLESLEVRRSQARVQFIGRMLNGHIDAPTLLEQIGLYASSRNLRARSAPNMVSRHSTFGSNEPLLLCVRAFNISTDHTHPLL